MGIPLVRMITETKNKEINKILFFVLHLGVITFDKDKSKKQMWEYIKIDTGFGREK